MTERLLPPEVTTTFRVVCETCDYESGDMECLEDAIEDKLIHQEENEGHIVDIASYAG